MSTATGPLSAASASSPPATDHVRQHSCCRCHDRPYTTEAGQVRPSPRACGIKESGERGENALVDLELLSAGLVIILIDLVLSGDNAVVIGMAAHRLPPRQRRIAILFGAGPAVVLRIALTAIATLLLQLPWIRLIGGGLLLWIGFKLLKEEEEV